MVMTPAVISASMFVTVVKMLSTLCSVCPVMAVELLTLSEQQDTNTMLNVQFSFCTHFYLFIYSI